MTRTVPYVPHFSPLGESIQTCINNCDPEQGVVHLFGTRTPTGGPVSGFNDNMYRSEAIELWFFCEVCRDLTVVGYANHKGTSERRMFRGEISEGGRVLLFARGKLDGYPEIYEKGYSAGTTELRTPAQPEPIGEI